MSKHSIPGLGKRSVDGISAGSNSARCGTSEMAGWTSPSSIDCYNIGTWNVRSLYQAGKLAGIIQEMERINLNLLGISETFWNDNGNSTLLSLLQMIHTKSSTLVDNKEGKELRI